MGGRRWNRKLSESVRLAVFLYTFSHAFILETQCGGSFVEWLMHWNSSTIKLQIVLNYWQA